MNWYALVDGRLVFIGNCGDWDAAYEVACDSIGETEWTWLASQQDVKQWVQCVLEAGYGEPYDPNPNRSYDGQPIMDYSLFVEE